MINKYDDNYSLKHFSKIYFKIIYQIFFNNLKIYKTYRSIKILGIEKSVPFLVILRTLCQ